MRSIRPRTNQRISERAYYQKGIRGSYPLDESWRGSDFDYYEDLLKDDPRDIGDRMNFDDGRVYEWQLRPKSKKDIDILSNFYLLGESAEEGWVQIHFLAIAA